VFKRTAQPWCAEMLQRRACCMAASDRARAKAGSSGVRLLPMAAEWEQHPLQIPWGLRAEHLLADWGRH